MNKFFLSVFSLFFLLLTSSFALAGHQNENLFKIPCIDESYEKLDLKYIFDVNNPDQFLKEDGNNDLISSHSTQVFMGYSMSSDGSKILLLGIPWLKREVLSKTPTDDLEIFIPKGRIYISDRKAFKETLKERTENIFIQAETPWRSVLLNKEKEFRRRLSEEEVIQLKIEVLTKLVAKQIVSD